MIKFLVNKTNATRGTETGLVMSNIQYHDVLFIQGGPKKTSDCVPRFNNCPCD